MRLGIAMSLALILVAGSAAIVPAVHAELVPTRIRTVGVGVPCSIAVGRSAVGLVVHRLRRRRAAGLGGRDRLRPGGQGRDLTGMH